MAKLPDYLICQNSSALPSAGLVLYTQPPFFYGKVWLCHSEEYFNSSMNEWVNSLELFLFSKIDGYWIVIVLTGSLQNTNMAEYKVILQDIVDGMAQMYFEERVSQKTGYYRKYKER